MVVIIFTFVSDAEPCLTNSSNLFLAFKILSSASSLFETTERIETGFADFLSFINIENSSNFSMFNTFAIGNSICSL